VEKSCAKEERRGLDRADIVRDDRADIVRDLRFPEVTILIHRITKDRWAGEYRQHIKKVLGYKHWDRRRKPKR